MIDKLLYRRSVVEKAWGIYRKYADHDLSRCDCTFFAVMRRRRIGVAFAFDDDFPSLRFIRARAE
jgi:predicted nucleic acid-binding protein